MLKFRFDCDVDYFELDPVAYAPALGEKGMASYRATLEVVRAGVRPEWHKSLKAADYWCTLLDEHRPTDLLGARVLVFRRWPAWSKTN